MAYVIASETVGLAISPVPETAKDLHDALSKARDTGTASKGIFVRHRKIFFKTPNDIM